MLGSITTFELLEAMWLLSKDETDDLVRASCDVLRSPFIQVSDLIAMCTELTSHQKCWLLK